MRAAYQGVSGAFGELAARRLFPQAAPVGVETFDDVVRAVETGTVDAGVLPVHNDIVGRVEPAWAALAGARRLVIAGGVDVPVRLHLQGLEGAELGRIERIASHPLALAQCRGLLGRLPGVASLDWYDSAAAAREVADRGDPALAAIASEEAARLYGLRILEPGVQDRPDNSTRFVGIVQRREPEADRPRRPAAVAADRERP